MITLDDIKPDRDTLKMILDREGDHFRNNFTTYVDSINKKMKSGDLVIEIENVMTDCSLWPEGLIPRELFSKPNKAILLSELESQGVEVFDFDTRLDEIKVTEIHATNELDIIAEFQINERLVLPLLGLSMGHERGIAYKIGSGFSFNLDDVFISKPQTKSNQETTPQYQDRKSEQYAAELDIAIKAYQAVIVEGWKAKTNHGGFTGHLKEWLGQNYPDASAAFIGRLSTVSNPKKDYPKQK